VKLCAGLADDLLQNLRGVVWQMRQHEGVVLAPAIAGLVAPFPRPRVVLDSLIEPFPFHWIKFRRQV
jgi:hypothetical protein